MSSAGERRDVVVEARDVAVHYGGIKAVDGVSFSLQEGRIFGILGPNGSGKSTLLAALTGLVRLTRGSFRLEGVDYRSRSAVSIARHGVARSFQTARLVPGLTVRENVQLAAEQPWAMRSGRDSRRFLRRRDLRSAARRVVDALERTGLAGLEDLRPSELPYGTQRRVEIARAIAMEPTLLVLDEPTAGMNHLEREEVCELLQRLRDDEGLTQLVVEHDVQMLVSTCDHLLAMNFGRLIAQGAPEDVVREPEVREAYLGKRWRNRA